MAEVTGEKPARGFRFLGDEVRREAVFAREEVEAALARYQELAQQAVDTGDWNAWADQFTDDAIYVEHHYGVFRGQDAIREWITATMQGPVADMVFPVEHALIDNDLVVIYVPNRFLAPDGGESYQFVAITILCYAGDGRWCYEEDIYDSVEAGRVVAAYGEAKQAAG